MSRNGLKTFPSPELVAFLKSETREKFNRQLLVGAKDSENRELLSLLNKEKRLNYDALKKFIIDEREVNTTYYDENGVLTASITLDSREKESYLYAVVLMSEDRALATISLLAVPFWLDTISDGEIIVKLPISGEVGDVVFRNESGFVSEQEVEDLYLLPLVGSMSFEAERIVRDFNKEIKEIK